MLFGLVMPVSMMAMSFYQSRFRSGHSRRLLHGWHNQTDVLLTPGVNGTNMLVQPGLFAAML